MTRATLLHVLARPTALGPAEVRELEQLAQAFPYCQTAHLLLAKAAHDQGTMLAGQRLRRAATYAADRTLLRRLIEQVEPAPVVEHAPEAAPAPPPEPEVLQPVQVQPEAAPTPAPVAMAPVEEVAVPAPTPEIPPTPVPQLPTPAPEMAPAPDKEPEAQLPAPQVEPASPASAEPEAPAQEPIAVTPEPRTEPAAEPPVEVPEAEHAPELVAALPTDTVPVEVPAAHIDIASDLVDKEGVDIPTVEPAFTASAEAIPEVEPDLPPQAPAIRPPVEVGEARFEFGLAETPPPTPPAYELPGLVDEWAAAAVTLSLAGPDALPDFFAADKAAPVTPPLTPAAFTGDEVVGYGFGESSRLGFSMQLLSLLTDKAEAAELASSETAAAQPPAAPLPPAGAFFEPDPLLLHHWATHQPPPPPQPSSLDLINNFLRRQPRLTRPAMLPPSPSSQADLSVRSTRAEPDLASESLARILVRQGKTARAIEIYEKLMVKQPEKMAYFAAQIQSLQPPA